jgi:hypothetical protein
VRSRRGAWLLAALTLGVTWPAAALAQWAPARIAAANAADPTSPQALGEVDLTPPLVSLVLPGAGQHVLGQNRKWAYLALEVAGWAFFVERRRAGGDYRERYRDFAWQYGRIQSAARVDGDFEYYERLAHWTRSGAFDRDAGAPGVQPELDDTTFNGSVWSLATRIFLGEAQNVPETDPAYQGALAYYGEEAYETALLWDWSGAPGAQSEYTHLLDTSDSRFRQATTVLGVIIANHVLSATDAYLSARGRATAPRLRIVPDAALGSGWSVLLTVPLPR